MVTDVYLNQSKRLLETIGNATFFFLDQQNISRQSGALAKQIEIAMKTLTMTKPYTQVQPKPRTGWHYDNYFLEQLAKTRQAQNNNSKIVIA